jgi:exosortase A
MSSRISAEAAELAAPEVSQGSPVPQVGVLKADPSLRTAWLIRFSALGVALLWVLVWYWSSAASMALVWWRSETFAHGLVVYPIAIWLVWRKRADLVAVDCRLSVLGLLGVAAAGVAWLLGEVASVDAARHFGFVLLVACCVWAVLGTKLAKAIAFPLLFTMLAVPVGEFMLPVLIEHTADFTVGALRLTGIPVYREGNNFVVPTGHWSVVEACSGLRYLIASVTLGLLYAYLSYRSWRRRLLFVVASVIVPIVANWFRAYMIVMIGHLSEMKYAVGVDHLLYGWLFFGVVMLLLFWIGSFWREDTHETSDATPPAQAGTVASTAPSTVVAAAVLTCVVVVVAPLYMNLLNSRPVPNIRSMTVPSPSEGWQVAVSSSGPFRPHYVGAASEVQTVYQHSGRSVAMYTAYFVGERPGRELIAHRNGLIDPTARGWEKLRERVVRAAPAGFDTIETDIRAPAVGFVVRHWYWVGGDWVQRPEEVKLRQAVRRILGYGDDAAVVVVSTQADDRSGSAQTLLDRFVADMTPSIDAALRQVRISVPEISRPAAP